MDEAIKIADKICILKDGDILQFDTPENISKTQPMNLSKALSVKDESGITLNY